MHVKTATDIKEELKYLFGIANQNLFAFFIFNTSGPITPQSSTKIECNHSRHN